MWGFRTLVSFLVCISMHRVVAQETLLDAGKNFTTAITNGHATAGISFVHDKLTNLAGQPIAISKESVLQVFCFLGVECPVSQFYSARLDSLSTQFEGVQFVGVYSNLHDSIDDARRYTKEAKLTFPQIHDLDQSIARSLGATRVPEVVVVDRNNNVRYRGRIDDQYVPGTKRSAPSSEDLKRALELIIQGKQPIVTRTDANGCLITFAKTPRNNAEITFCKSIAPLFQRLCYECHRPGEIGPFDSSNYDEVRGWADMILEVVEQKRMPPWHADPKHGTFKNARSISDQEIALIREWVRSGTPYGSASDLPVQPKFVDGWRMTREPDLIVAMRNRPYSVPATGAVDYQYFVVDPHLTEDRWVSAAQIIPGDTTVVHHAIVFVRPPDGVGFQGVGWLTAYVPGQRATTFPSGFARKIPAGSKFVFQMHYTPNGSERVDQTKVGLCFLDSSSVTHEVYTTIGIDQEFEIPPGAANHSVSSTVRGLPKNGQLLAIMPHMHLRGKSFELTTVAGPMGDKSQQRKVLLSVPRYDFNWQHTYELSEPLDLSQVEQLDFTVTFDNSQSNPFNPAPDEYVVWGDQTWEEMAVAFIEVARPLQANAPAIASKSISDNRASAVAEATERDLNYARQFISKFDKNRDGRVVRSEVTRIVNDFVFYQLDGNRDGAVTHDELVSASKAKRVR
ncbi:MAG: redoxin domain-containing protein [Pirellula sp.]